MTSRRTFLGFAAAISFLPLSAIAQDRLPVVASFSILGDMVGRVGGDRVAVTTLVGPDGDAHVYQPSPADVKAVAAAKVVFVNGLGFEGWLDRLVAAAEYDRPMVIATNGLIPRDMVAGEADGHPPDEAGHDHAHTEAEDHAHDEAAHDEAGHDHGPSDPHAWQSVANVRTYVANIEAGLAAADPARAGIYRANAVAYLAELDALDAEIRAAVAALPEDRRTVVTSHDAFGYLAGAYGLAFVAPQGMSTETEASAADVAALITQVREQQILALFVENITDPRLLAQITAETGAVAGGTLFSDALSGPDGPAGTYIDMMRHNIATLVAALQS